MPWNLAAAYGRPSIDLISGLPAFRIIEAAKFSLGKACLRVIKSEDESEGNWRRNWEGLYYKLRTTY